MEMSDLKMFSSEETKRSFCCVTRDKNEVDALTASVVKTSVDIRSFTGDSLSDMFVAMIWAITAFTTVTRITTRRD
jgi:hypothetical protein